MAQPLFARAVNGMILVDLPGLSGGSMRHDQAEQWHETLRAAIVDARQQLGLSVPSHLEQRAVEVAGPAVEQRMLEHKAAEPQRLHRRWREIVGTAPVLAAWDRADLSEGQASEMLGLDRVSARQALEEAALTPNAFAHYQAIRSSLNLQALAGADWPRPPEAPASWTERWCVYCADPRRPKGHDGPCTEFTEAELDALEVEWLAGMTDQSLPALRGFLARRDTEVFDATTERERLEREVERRRAEYAASFARGMEWATPKEWQDAVARAYAIARLHVASDPDDAAEWQICAWGCRDALKRRLAETQEER